MMGRYDSEGKIHAILIRKLSKKVNLKLEGAFQSSNVEQGSLNAELNVESNDSHTSFKLQQGLFGVGISQRLHRNLIVGFDYYHIVNDLLFSLLRMFLCGATDLKLLSRITVCLLIMLLPKGTITWDTSSLSRREPNLLHITNTTLRIEKDQQL